MYERMLGGRWKLRWPGLMVISAHEAAASVDSLGYWDALQLFLRSVRKDGTEKFQQSGRLSARIEFSHSEIRRQGLGMVFSCQTFSKNWSATPCLDFESRTVLTPNLCYWKKSKARPTYDLEFMFPGKMSVSRWRTHTQNIGPGSRDVSSTTRERKKDRKKFGASAFSCIHIFRIWSGVSYSHAKSPYFKR